MTYKLFHIKCKDHLISGEEFKLEKTDIPGILKTIPVPDPSEIGKYYESDSYISHTDSQENLIDKIYQIVKKYSIKQKYKTILKLKKNTQTLLDIGSGTGDFLNASHEYGISSTGTEPNEHARRLSISKGNKVVEDLYQLESNKFDVITLWHVLEHVYQPSEYLEKINHLLNQDGLLLIAVPNYESYDAKYYKEFWAAYDVPRHLWHFNKNGMETLLNNEGFKITKVKALPFDSFYVSLLSEKNKTGNNNLIKAFLNGLISNIKAISTKEYSSILYIAQRKVN